MEIELFRVNDCWPMALSKVTKQAQGWSSGESIGWTGFNSPSGYWLTPLLASYDSEYEGGGNQATKWIHAYTMAKDGRCLRKTLEWMPIYEEDEMTSQKEGRNKRTKTKRQVNALHRARKPDDGQENKRSREESDNVKRDRRGAKHKRCDMPKEKHEIALVIWDV